MYFNITRSYSRYLENLTDLPIHIEILLRTHGIEL